MKSDSATAAATATEQGLTLAEIEQANLHLEQTRNGVIGAIAGLSQAQWTFKPTGAWSIAENVEHIATVQERVLALLQDVLPTAPPPPAEHNVAAVDAITINHFPNRLTKFPSPEATHPKGDWELRYARDRVTANTKRFTACLESTPDLRQHALDSPPLKAISKGEYQVMDGYQWILAASAHTERHTKQILEVKADPKFPEQ